MNAMIKCILGENSGLYIYSFLSYNKKNKFIVLKTGFASKFNLILFFPFILKSKLETTLEVEHL